jgi:hypothetical protein
LNPNGNDTFADDVMTSRQYGDIIKNQRRKKTLIAKTLKYLLYIAVILALFLIGRCLLRSRMSAGKEISLEIKNEKIY